MTLHDMPLAQAGRYLKKYENAHYTLRDKIGNPFQSITVDPAAEEFCDFSFWEAGMNWDEYAKHYRAAIIRLGQGSMPDTEFRVNYTAARGLGLLLGGYWFYDGRTSPQTQAQLIITLMQGKYLDMELFVDWERNYGGAFEGDKNVAELMRLLDNAHLKVHDIGLYTGYYWYLGNTSKTQDSYFKTKPLWLAWYASPSVVKVPAPWSTWTHWQKGTPSIKVGQPTAEIDANVFNGSQATFSEKYGATNQMVKGTVLATPSMNIRSTPDLSGTDVGDLFTGDIVYGDLVNGWIHIQQIWRKTGVIEMNTNYALASNSAWMKVETVTAIPVPPSTQPAKYEVILNEMDEAGNIIATYRGLVSK